MSEQQQEPAQPPDVLQLWREWLTQSERQFNALFNQGMNTDAFARSFGGYVEMNAQFQRLIAEGMQRYLSFVNMPSRKDVLSLSETLQSIEERLLRIEDLLSSSSIASEAADSGGPFAEDGPFTPQRPFDEPPRTRRPEVMPIPTEDDIAELADVPKELRR